MTTAAVKLAILMLKDRAAEDLEGYARVGYEQACEDMLEAIDEWEADDD